jgi:hypothetical protein
MSPLRVLDRHFGEGLCRIIAQPGMLAEIGTDGWEGLLAIISWCGRRGSLLKAISYGTSATLPEDDPAMQCYRAVYLLLNTEEVESRVPFTIAWSLRCLVAAGGNRNHTQLSLASLDLLGVLNERAIRYVERHGLLPDDQFWSESWRLIVDGIAEAAELSCDTVRNKKKHSDDYIEASSNCRSCIHDRISGNTPCQC